MSKITNEVLYHQSAVIHAAVHATVDIAIQYHARSLVATQEDARKELFESLIDFFGEYDRTRTDQVEELQKRYIALLQNTPAPILLDKNLFKKG